MATNMGAQKARTMKSGSGSFDIDDFVSKLLKFLKDDQLPEDVFSDDSDAEGSNDFATPLDWDRIVRKAMVKSRRIPVMSFMYGFPHAWLFLSTEPQVGWAHCPLNRRRGQTLTSERDFRKTKKMREGLKNLKKQIFHVHKTKPPKTLL
jgi:hypothetical protein